MKKVRQALRDQKETPLERSLWYIEYAARTKGAPNLQSPGLRLRWYELYMLDILAVVMLAGGLLLWLVSRMVASFARLLITNAPRAAKAKTQ